MKTLFKAIAAFVVGGFMLILFVAVFRTATVMSASEDTPSGTTPSGHIVSYVVNGAGLASVTYQNEQGGTQQEEIKTPWSKSFTINGQQFLYLSAQNHEETGGITSEIIVDGKSFKRSESIGGHVIASASGRCC